jgi:hypothetical protein
MQSAVTGLNSLLGLQEVLAPIPESLDDRHMKVERLSDLRTGRLYSPGDTASTHFCYRPTPVPQTMNAATLFVPHTTYRKAAQTALCSALY